jgi:hypothetical protein
MTVLGWMLIVFAVGCFCVLAFGSDDFPDDL